jgi:hypothetical protein
VLVTFTVAGVVLVASLAAAILLRPRPNSGSDGPSAAATTTLAVGPVQCDNGPCQLLATATAGDSTVRLLADTIDPARPAAQQSGRVQFTAKTGTIVFETNISQDDAALTRSSLSCLSTGAVPACLVFGEASSTDARDGALGEVFIERGGYWARPSYDLFYSSAGYFTLWEGVGDTEPEVLTVQNDCGTTKDDQCATPKVYMQLFSLGVVDATSCTKSVGAISLLPGHGTTKPPASDLQDCPNSAG